MLNPTLQAPAEAEADVHAAARAFGAALKSSPEFTALLAADEAISTDAEANAAIVAFEQLQQDYRAEMTVGVLTDAHRADLERGQAAMLAVPTVAAYAAAMSAFQDVCRDTASVVTAEIGIDFAANSRSGGCCG